MGDPEAVWARICRHIEGLSVVSTLVGMAELGAFERCRQGIAVPATAVVGSGRPGYCALALRLLVRVGWLSTEGGGLVLTNRGAALAEALPAFQAIHAGDSAAAYRIAADLPADLAALVTDYADAFQLAPLLLAMNDAARNGMQSRGWPPATDAGAFAALRRLGWVGGSRDLTDQGRWAVRFAVQYRHVLSYRPLLARVPALLSGADTFDPTADGGRETHINRLEDIRFSGDVYRATCGLTVSAMIAEMPLDGLPYLIDVGAGDGTMLEALYRELAPRAPDLVAVAVEPSLDAREFLAARFAEAGIPYRVLDGDVGEPIGLARRLREADIDVSRSLTAMKSVMHDRTLRRASFDTTRVSSYRTVYAGADGVAVPSAVVETDLIDCLKDWRGVLGPAGMLMVEAHTAPTDLPVLPTHGIVVALDATQGYSQQYLLEAETHLECCKEAGFSVVSRTLTGGLGFPMMTCSWLRSETEALA
jgi:hypothetical protein